MIFVVAGIPAKHFNRIQKKAPTIFGDKPLFIGASLRPGHDGAYHLDKSHVEKLALSLCQRLKENPKLREKGCALIVISQEKNDISSILKIFRPFSLVRSITLPVPVVTSGRSGEMYCNQLSNILRDAAKPLQRAIKAMKTELRARLNRTPLLLPLRNFNSEFVRQTILELASDLPLADKPTETISETCKRIESKFPFSKMEGGSRRCFQNSSGIQFRPPKGALHGSAFSFDPPHNYSCYLNGIFRLGASYERGFHYDCIRCHSNNQNNMPIKGKFCNCHDVFENKHGSPHINIYPNDYTRT